MIRILHLSDLHLGTTTHGKINPHTGINSRIEDFRKALHTCISEALARGVDLVLFGGDAFPDATPPPLVQQAFAEEFRRLEGVPIVFLVGNHDQYAQGQGGCSLAIYRSLAIPNVIVGDTVATHGIPTRGGTVQVITLPWLSKSHLLTRQELSDLSSSEVEVLFREKLALILEGEIRQLDPHLPTILLAHVLVEGAELGAERFLMTGKGFQLPLSWFVRPEFTYVALGHVHRHQCLCSDPPVVYAGSLERVDFGEEQETKGYCWLEITAPHQVSWQFCPLPARSFCTIRLDVRGRTDPHLAIIQAINTKMRAGAIVRLIYQIHAEQLPLVNESEIHQTLATSHSYSIQPQIIPAANFTKTNSLDPLLVADPIQALATYLATRPDWQNQHLDLLGLARELLHDASDPQQLAIGL
ncbi:MAG: exonuclease SbcCD subunit D [Pseudanabaenaceae cyanobacterium]